jgi:hypothetical protein
MKENNGENLFEEEKAANEKAARVFFERIAQEKLEQALKDLGLINLNDEKIKDIFTQEDLDKYRKILEKIKGNDNQIKLFAEEIAKIAACLQGILSSVERQEIVAWKEHITNQLEEMKNRYK